MMYPERSVAIRQMHLGKEHMSVSVNQVLLVITATVLVNTINCHVFKLTVFRKFKSKIYREISKINLSVYITPLHLSGKKKNGKARILPLEYDKKTQRNREAYTTWAFSIKLQRINLILI